MRLEGKTALVTGGGTGIGAATARRFAAEGARVVVLGPEQEPLEQVAAEIGAAAVVGDAASAADVGRALSAAGGRLDVLVTCAGGEGWGSLSDVDEETWERHIRINLTTAVVAVRESLPLLASSGRGSIVVIASVAGLTAANNLVTYTTAKTALLGFVRSLAVDYGPRGVRANAICPGWTHTRMARPIIESFAERLGLSLDETLERVNALVPLRRWAEPDEIAAACLFLASDESSFVTGTALVADGGQSAVNVGTAPFVFF